MSYRQAVLFRWSTRDLLAVLVLAAILAFLTGSAIFYTAAVDKPTEIAREYQSVGEIAEYESVARAEQAANDDAAVLPFAELDDSNRLLVAVSSEAEARLSTFDVAVPPVPRTGVGDATAATDGQVTIRSGTTTRTVDVSPLPNNGLFPGRWLVTRPAVVEPLDPSGAFVVSPPATSGSNEASPDRTSSSLLRGTLSFFERGTAQLLNGFVFLVVVAAALGAVTIASVVRMTVRDRTETIQIIRATGATPLSVARLFALRGLLLTAAAVALGYAIGVVTSSVVTSVAVSAGLPTTLSPQVTLETARLLAVSYVSILAVGFCAGALAAVPVVRRPPGRLTAPPSPSNRVGDLARRVPGGERARSVFETRILDWRAAFPTIATITVFVSIALLVTASGAVAEPLGAGDESTIVESGVAHPIASSVPESYAAAFSSENVAASPEIPVFGVVNDRPTLVRGADFASYAAVSDATLVRGRIMNDSAEAMIGADLARTQGLDVGETVVVGSGTQRTVERVRIVGTFRAPSAFDDQLLVSLESGRHLTSLGPDSVKFVRLSGDVEQTRLDPPVRVVSTRIRGVPTTEGVAVESTVVNVDDRNRTRSISFSLGDERTTESISLPPRGRTTVSTRFTPNAPGNYTLTVDERSRPIEVRQANGLVLQGVPSEAPPGSAPLVRVRTVVGDPIANVSVTVAERTRRTDAAGRVRLPLSTRGTHTIRASHGEFTAAERVTVSDSANRSLQVSLTVEPDPASAFSRPTARLSLSNPWNETAAGSLSITGPDSEVRRSYRLNPGETSTVESGLARLPSGEYDVSAALDGDRVAETSYTVSGDDRLSTVIARNTDATSGSGLGRAISVAFGNLTVIVAALVGLAGLMVSGALAASFARAIHARRATLGVYRATGASPRSVVATVTGDALRIGSVSVLVGIVLGAALVSVFDAFGLLVVFGIRVTPTLTPDVLVGVGVAATGLVLIGALVPTLVAVRAPPAASFDRVNRRAGDDA